MLLVRRALPLALCAIAMGACAPASAPPPRSNAPPAPSYAARYPPQVQAPYGYGAPYPPQPQQPQAYRPPYAPPPAYPQPYAPPYPPPAAPAPQAYAPPAPQPAPIVAPQPAPVYPPPAPAPYAPPPAEPPRAPPVVTAPPPIAAPALPSAPAATGRPMLPPLVGELAWRAEVSQVLSELIASLPADKAAMVRGIPLQFDPSPTEINAYAGCDKQGSPFLAATVGLLYAVDAIAQTEATDELFGTHTYDAYAGLIAPELVKPKGASPALPLGVIPVQYVLRPDRLSRAHELFDEIVAFTFGHELSHHYLGHTGCAIGQGNGGLPDITAVGRVLSGLAPGFNQPNEIAADSAGVNNVLDTGRARLPNYRWTEKGGLLLLDFFARMDRAAGMSPLNPIGFLQTHPNPALRIPIAQTVARTWWLQHPGP